MSQLLLNFGGEGQTKQEKHKTATYFIEEKIGSLTTPTVTIPAVNSGINVVFKHLVVILMHFR